MTTSTRTRRFRRIALLAGTAGALAFIAPTAAHADTYNSQRLAPGGSLCVSLYASYQTRVEGTASNQGA